MEFFETEKYKSVIAEIDLQLRAKPEKLTSDDYGINSNFIAKKLNIPNTTILTYFGYYIKYIKAARELRKRKEFNSPSIDECSLATIGFEDLNVNQEVFVPIPGFEELFRSSVTAINTENKTFRVHRCSIDFSNDTKILIQK